jgi:hypothetical protein
MQRPRWIFVAAAVAATALLTTACTDDDPTPAPTASSAPPPARYREIAGGCPRLKSPEAKKLNASGDPGPETQPAGNGVTVQCRWQAGKYPWLRISVTFFANGQHPALTGIGDARQFFTDARAAADQQVTTLTTAKAEVTEVLDVADPAFLLAVGSDHTLVRTTLADNAVIQVSIVNGEPDGVDGVARPADLRRQFAAPAGAVTTETLGQLR